MTERISIGQLGTVAGSKPRALKKAFLAIVAGERKTWRGAALVIHQVHGRGGRSGWSYEVEVNSLPYDLQERWKALQTPVQLTLKLDEDSAADREWWTAVLAPASGHPARSKERTGAVRAILAAEHIRDGKRERVSERTVSRKLRALDRQGLAGLTRKKRVGAGERAVILSRAWDKAVPFDDGVKQTIAHELRQHVRGMLKGGEATTLLRMGAALRLAEMTRAAGFDPGAAPLAACCAVPIGFVRAERDFRKVATFKTDRKTYEDRRPRIRRTREGMMPMECVVADVHPLDIACRRPDGTVAHPRGIAWLDLGNNRIHVDWVLPEPREGIRNNHVIASFRRMVTAWGAPAGLYLDNGSEYNWAPFIDDALRLTDGHGRRLLGDLAPWATRSSNIVRARAYNAQAKPIEGIFGVLETRYFQTIPGHIGGDRLRKKTANHGREPEPFPGTFEQLRELLDMAVRTYNAMPQLGSALGGKSPDGALQAAIDAGWGMVAVDPDAFRLAFATEEVRTVRQGCISVNGQPWTSRALQGHQGNTVTVLLPKFDDWSRLPIRDEANRPLGFVEIDRGYGFLDPAGAVEAGERERAHRRGVAALDRSAPSPVVQHERAKLASALLPPPIPPVTGQISASDEAKAHGSLARETPDEHKARISAEAEKRMRDAAADNAWHTEQSKKYVKNIPGKK